MTQTELAEAAGVSANTIKNFETGKRDPLKKNLDDMIAALEAAGVEFTNHGEPGVKLVAKPKKRTPRAG
jgi:transcriptional regulator with XRE-family HTH domain